MTAARMIRRVILEFRDDDGVSVKVTEQTFLAWVRAYEQGGQSGLMDAATSRVVTLSNVVEGWRREEQADPNGSLHAMRAYQRVLDRMRDTWPSLRPPKVNE